MKKCIISFLALLLLVGCSARSYTPAISSSFKSNAVFCRVDFSFLCTVEYDSKSLRLKVNSTNAEGMTISTDGKLVSFEYNKMKKDYDINDVAPYNPAVVLFDVLSSLPDADVSRVDNTFKYTGKSRVGNYILTQSDDNTYKSIVIPDAKIKIEFVK